MTKSRSNKSRNCLSVKLTHFLHRFTKLQIYVNIWKEKVQMILIKTKILSIYHSSITNLKVWSWSWLFNSSYLDQCIQAWLWRSPSCLYCEHIQRHVICFINSITSSSMTMYPFLFVSFGIILLAFCSGRIPSQASLSRLTLSGQGGPTDFLSVVLFGISLSKTHFKRSHSVSVLDLDKLDMEAQVHSLWSFNCNNSERHRI